jgi:hypothetical protein
MLFCTPVFVRTSGLGNKLFPWARCAIYCANHGGVMLPAGWFGLRRGPLFRDGLLCGGLTFRSYLGKVLLLNNFHEPAFSNIIRRRLYLNRFKVQNEASTEHICNSAEDVVLRFIGDGRHFLDLAGHQRLLQRRLFEISNLSKGVTTRSYPKILLNVRLARDFRLAKSDLEFQLRGALRTPINWYRDVLARIRKELERDEPALIISDGQDHELKPLLDTPNVIRFYSTKAIDDLYALSKARLIIGAGGSSFTAWGAFFSQSDVITVAGQNLSWFGLDQSSKGCVTAWSLDLQERPNMQEIIARLQLP